MECTILKAGNTKIEILFSEEVQKSLEEKGLWKKDEIWIVESPPGTEIPIASISYPDNKRAIINLKSRLKKGEWVRFTLLEDRLLKDKIIAQTSAVVGGGGRPEGGDDKDWDPKLTDAIQDLSSYPFPVTDANIAEPSSSGISGPTSFTRLVDGAMKTALGRLPKSDDTRSFVGALNQSFKLTQSEGHTVVEWTPHSLSGTTDLGGGVTGAQASLVAFARNALNASLPLLDGLYSLIPDADPQEVEATKSIVHSQWTDVVELFELEGGPTDSRADQFFDSLNDQITHLGELLGMLDDEGEITRENVITPDEEGNLTNFIAFSNYVKYVFQYYEDYSELRESNEDLGTGLTLLSRALSVVGEQVAEVYASMDSVHVGPAERQVITLQLPDGTTTTRMTVEELLSWVDTFSTEEAPRLIQDGGLRGIEAIEPTAKKLKSLTDEFLKLVKEANPNLPVALHQRRVRNTLSELVRYLTELEKQIDRLVPEVGIDMKKKDSLDELKRDFALFQERLRKLDDDGAVEPKLAA